MDAMVRHITRRLPPLMIVVTNNDQWLFTIPSSIEMFEFTTFIINQSSQSRELKKLLHQGFIVKVVHRDHLDSESDIHPLIDIATIAKSIGIANPTLDTLRSRFDVDVHDTSRLIYHVYSAMCGRVMLPTFLSVPSSLSLNEMVYANNLMKHAIQDIAKQIVGTPENPGLLTTELFCRFRFRPFTHTNFFRVSRMLISTFHLNPGIRNKIVSKASELYIDEFIMYKTSITYRFEPIFPNEGNDMCQSKNSVDRKRNSRDGV